MQKFIHTTAMLLVSVCLSSCSNSGKMTYVQDTEQAKQLENKLKLVQTQSEQKLSQANKEKEKAEEKVRQIEAKLAESEKQKNEIVLQLKEAQANLQKAEEHFTKVNETENTINADKVAAQQALAKAQNDLSAIQQRLEQANKTAQENEQAKEIAQAAVNKANTEIAKLNAEIATLNSQIPQTWSYTLDGKIWRTLDFVETNENRETRTLRGRVQQQNAIRDVSLFNKSVDANRLNAFVDLSSVPVDDNVHHIEVKDNNQQKIADVQLTNQTYSSYMTWRSMPNVEHIFEKGVLYVALPTDGVVSGVTKNLVQAVYRGKIIETDNNKTTSGNLKLNVDFGDWLIWGDITDRADNKPDYELGRGTVYLNVNNRNAIQFYGRAYEKGQFSDGVTYRGGFAGPNAEEVVGQVGTGIAFGGHKTEESPSQ